MIYDLAIIGGGPAGVGAGVYASRKRLKTIFITKDFDGQSAVSEGIENWIGTVKISGGDLAKSLETHLRAYAGDIVDIKTGELCESIKKQGDASSKDVFEIKTSKGIYSAKTILITAGSSRRKLQIPGADKFEHKGLTYCATCDGPLFADQDVTVVGGGNAAFETASQLLAYCKSVTLLNRGDEFRADPVTVQKVLANPKMRAVKNAVPKEIKGDKFVSSIVYNNGSTDIEIAVGGIFAEIGSLPNTAFAKDVVQLDPYNRVIVDPRTQRAQPVVTTNGTDNAGEVAIWSAGDCTDGLYHQNNIATGDAVKALEDIYLFLNAR